MSDTPTLEQLPRTFDEWWSAPGQWVEEPNQARSGWSGVMRVFVGEALYYVKKQHNYSCRTWKHPFSGIPTVSREFQNILALSLLDLPAPVPVFHGTRKSAGNRDAILVTEALDGFVDFDHLPPLSDAQAKQLAELAGCAVGRLHRAGFRHGCLYGKHLMAKHIDSAPEIAFIDLEKLRPAIFRARAIRHDLEQLQRRQGIWNTTHWQAFLAAHECALKGQATASGKVY